MACGVGIAYSGVSPVSILLGASIAGGVATPVTIGYLIRLASDPEVMGDHAIPKSWQVAAWAITVLIGGLGLVYLLGQIGG